MKSGGRDGGRGGLDGQGSGVSAKNTQIDEQQGGRHPFSLTDTLQAAAR